MASGLDSREVVSAGLDAPLSGRQDARRYNLRRNMGEQFVLHLNGGFG